MGLGKLFRSTTYTAVNDVTGQTGTFVVLDNIAPEWGVGHYEGGMSIPGAWRAALLLSDLIGSVPWDAYRSYGGTPIEKISPTPPLLDQPSPPDSRMTTFSSWALDLIWHGNAFGVIAARNPQGWPTAVVPVPAQFVLARRVPLWDGSPLPVGSIEYKIGHESFTPDDIIHIKGPTAPGRLRGMGVLESHFHTLNLSHELTRQAGNLSKNGVPSGLLKVSNPDATPTALEDAKTGWLKSQRDRTVAVLNATTEFVPLSWNPTDMQLLEARKFSLTELALIFGLPLSFLGAEMASKTYSNAENESLNLIKFSMGGHLARFEQTLALHFPRGTWVKANLDSILRADTKTRYEAHQVGIAAGFLTVDEVREIEDMPPLTAAQKAELAPKPVVPVSAPVADPNTTPEASNGTA